MTLIPSIEQLSRIIGSVAATAVLLDAVAAFASVLISRLNRVIDCSRFLHAIVQGDEKKAHLKSDTPRLKRRAVLLNQSIFLLHCLHRHHCFFAHEYGVAILFVAALSFFLLAIINLVRETRIALHDFLASYVVAFARVSRAGLGGS